MNRYYVLSVVSNSSATRIMALGKFYVKNLENCLPDAALKQLRLIRMRLEWLPKTLPDYQLGILKLAPVTEHQFDK